MPPEKAEKKFSISRVGSWYARFERPISSFSLVGGFVFDALTLKRVDMFWENFWVVAHLLLVAICILLINIGENEGLDADDPFNAIQGRPESNRMDDPEKIRFWLVNILQFLFGGLLSTFLVFYFRSGSLAVSWPFFLILAAAFVANESFKKRYVRLSFQIGLFFLSIFSFAVFLVPIVLRRIGPDMFLLSGGASIALIIAFLFVLNKFAGEKFSKSKRIIFFAVSGIFLAMNILYFLNVIPPIPLSLKDAGVYHSLTRNANGDYAVTGESYGGWQSFFGLPEDFHETPGGAVYAYSAIFSPTDLNATIAHEWQMYDGHFGKWVTKTRVELPLVGGREGGYRTYSMKNELAPGRWRVNVETARGELIGRLRFNVIFQIAEPELVTDIKS
ncbi:MAG: DUF2914 domain-containing protein [Candidatus Liptonbacteria bacterium]|nr:DUF2914 domain-containing protein [Candidatus Liptonbacteria bacterium]